MTRVLKTERPLSFSSYQGDFIEDGKELVWDHVSGGIGWITLNRPKALNALSLPMMVRLLDLIQKWEKDPDVTCVIIQGNGPRAFCSGGDLKGVHQAYQANDFAFLDFLFRTEYTFNARLYAFSKPYLSLIHGIVMGGGVGASIHGSHRLVTDSTLFAMPETGIGYFPDVGGTYFLNQCPQEIGLYIGLTGNRIKAGDILYAGFATHYSDEKNFEELRQSLTQSPPSSYKGLDERLSTFSSPFPKSDLKEYHDVLKRCFLHSSLDEIFESLAQEPSSFARETLNVLQTRSPLSLQVTFKQLTEGKGLSFNQVMKREFALSQSLLRRSDFIEGIRAAVVDKDRQPKWGDFPYTDEAISKYFDLPADIPELKI